MFLGRLRALSVVFACADVLLTAMAFAGAYLMRHALLPWMRSQLGWESLPPLGLYPFTRYLPVLFAILVIWLAAGYLLGAYHPRELRERRQALADPTKQTLAGALLLGAGLFFFREFYVSRLLLAGFVVLDWVLLVGMRLAFLTWGPRLREKLGGGYYILLVGAGERAREMADLVRDSRAAGLHLVGLAAPAGDEAAAGLESVPRFPLAEVPRLLREHVVDEVIFCVRREELEHMEDLFLICEEQGVRTRVRLQIFPHLLSQVHLDHLRHVPLLTFSTVPENQFHLLVKRAADAVAAALLLVVLSPLFAVLALLVKLTSPGPVLYRQLRCGLGGRRFLLYKFRSMAADADLRRDDLRALNEADGPVFKMVNDPRCTRVGRWMRRFSLDELPQLWNVLKGDMSFVGPRPPIPEEVEQYEPWQRRRLRMRPGLTCLWALEGRSRLSFRRWMQLDLDYIDTWSLWLDLKIFLKTIPRVLAGRGAA